MSVTRLGIQPISAASPVCTGAGDVTLYIATKSRVGCEPVAKITHAGCFL